MDTRCTLSAVVAILLLTFHAPSAISQRAGSTGITCPEPSRIPNCECSAAKFECPKMNAILTVELLTSSDKVEVTCHDDLPSDLPNLHIGNVSVLNVINCKPLAGKPLLETLSFLGVNSIKQLYHKNWESKLSFTAVTFESLQNLENLTLVDGIEHIEVDGFNNLPHLQRLRIKHNKLNLQVGIFDNLPELSTLILWQNEISQLQSGIFRNQRKLQNLELKLNNLREINNCTFQGLQNLNYLDLSANAIESLSTNAFSLLPNLSELNLGFNRLSTITGNLTNNCQLKSFTLVFNKVPLALPDHFLSHLLELQEVYLQNSMLSYLPENVFSESTAITKLNLSNNMLKQLPESLLNDQHDLKLLYLDRNRLERLPEKLFSTNRKISVLQLSNNLLQNLTDNIFATLGALQELHLENNHLHLITDSTFEKTTSLQELYLQNNRLAFHATSFYHDGINIAESYHSPFQYLEHLRVLNLHNNSITTIFQDWQANTLQLSQLDLSYNAISQLSQIYDLNFFSTDINVDLSHNRISHISVADLDQGMSHVKVRLAGNPLNCDCDLLHFIQYVTAKKESHIKFITDHLRCSEPSELSGNCFDSLQSEKLVCPLTGNNAGCPPECNCHKRSFDLTIVVNCTDRGLTEIRSLPEPSSVNYNSTELHLENNYITELPTSNMSGYEKVVALHARNNSIEKVSLKNIPRHLRHLDLTHNKLTTVDKTMLDALNRSAYLTRLQLSNNPWKCDCSTKDFMHFVQENHLKLSTDRSLILCEDGRKIDSLTVNELCDENAGVLIVTCLILAFSGLLIGLFSALYYSYQMEIKVWLFTHNLFLWLITEEELDRNKEYDAFISYSHKDAEFVENVLVPRMENLMNFKTCVHERDWIPGETIPEQIISSVESSRRTVIVLSKHYLESTWTTMEFRTAHLQSLTEKRIRVIVIMYGDIRNVDSLDSELKAYLKMNTYVKHEDPWFWDKLRYAMPHPVTPAELKKKNKKRTEKEMAIILEKISAIEPLPASV